MRRNTQQQITNAYGSVNLINNIIGEKKGEFKFEIPKVSQKLIKRVDINTKHLEFMLTLVWFQSALDGKQSSDIETCISDAQNWIAQNDGSGPDPKR